MFKKRSVFVNRISLFQLNHRVNCPPHEHVREELSIANILNGTFCGVNRMLEHTAIQVTVPTYLEFYINHLGGKVGNSRNRGVLVDSMTALIASVAIFVAIMPPF